MGKKKYTLLLVDDDPDILYSLKLFLGRFYSEVITLSDPKKIMSTLSQSVVDLVLMDMNFRRGEQSGNEGLYWLKRINEVSPETVVVLMTAYSSVGLAVEGIKLGAYDFLLKPWDNDKLLVTIDGGIAQRKSKKQGEKFKKITTSLDMDGHRVIGTSKAFKEVVNMVEKVADTNANVLLLGENGTGKFVVAKMLHNLSSRRDKIFAHVDLGSLNGNLFESELFGYAKGAFTDAREDSIGRFELADEGTLFLDEIGNLPIHLQTKLLSVLQNRKVVRLGESRERAIDVRIICATNMDLHAMVEQKEFRQDLLYRINTMEILVPPLRDRVDDIPLLATFFLERNKKKYQKGKLQFSPAAIEALKDYRWPGNVRELEHMVERAVILCDENEISESDLHFGPQRKKENFIASLNLEETERMLVEMALEKHRGNVTNAARDLGITRAALYRRMEKYKL
ncbi:sigma-54-dependent transcriptional regulator [Maribacter polysiphoniae]|uniref:sigma-54-dependent transcriptional regulator n=1 Tax=Maribacter polysiphoniae TaxID=429344 RepID=UPI0023545430|nr:sigma-54 dependent transcriptional regulator [Maribacter polysiphoniae]